MATWWRWFLSGAALLLAARASYAQAPLPAGNCASRAYQDSLVARYLDRGAERVGYLDPRWAQYCDSVLLRCPNVAQAYQLKAVPLIKDGKYAEAFALEDQAVAHDPRAWLAYRGFLKCIFTKDYAGALTDFEAAERLKPNSREMDHTYPFWLGICHLELGELPAATAAFARDRQQQLGPGGEGSVHFNSLLYAGIARYEAHHYAPAADLLRQCLRQYARHPEANYYLALTLRAQGQPSEAARYLQIAQDALAAGYRLNEDNLYYANYPHQITAYEVQQALVEARGPAPH